jgi:hypothetical protein
MLALRIRRFAWYPTETIGERMKLSKTRIGILIFVIIASIILITVNSIISKKNKFSCYGINDAKAVALVRKKMKGLTTPSLQSIDTASLNVLSIRETLPVNELKDNVDYYGKIISFGRGKNLELKATVYSDCGVEWSK